MKGGGAGKEAIIIFLHPLLIGGRMGIVHTFTFVVINDS